MPVGVACAALLVVTPAQDETAPRTDADRQILAEAEEIEAEVARLRERPFRHPVDKQVYSREQLAEVVARELATPEAQEELADAQAFLRAIGFLPPSVELGDLYRDLLGSQVAGFYDPEDRTLRCISSELAFVQRLTLVHEIYHSLQDQYVPLEPYMEAPEAEPDSAARRSDASRARQAVVEGDAQYFTMGQYSPRHRAEINADLKGQSPGALIGFGIGQALAQASIPPYFVDELSWPYLAGAEFIEALHAQGGWEAVDRAFAEPPASTEQILHPRKYLDGDDPPLAVRAPSPELAKGFDEVLRDTLGEATLAALLRHLGHDPVHATRGSEGWGGDEVVVLRSPQGEDLLVWLLVFDRERDGDQFTAAWRRVLAKQYESAGEGGEGSVSAVEPGLLPEGTAGFMASRPLGVPSWLLQRGARVLLLRGAPLESRSTTELAALAGALEPW